MLRVDVLTLFPELITVPLSQSIMGRAAEAGLIEVRAHQLRDWTHDKYRRTDDYLCGGGQGMLMKCEPIPTAESHTICNSLSSRVFLMQPHNFRFLFHKMATTNPSPHILKLLLSPSKV